MLSKHGRRKTSKQYYHEILFLWSSQDPWILCRNVRQFKTFSALRNWTDSRRCSWWFFISWDCNLWIALQQQWWRSGQLEWWALFCPLRVNCIFSVWTAWWVLPRHQPSPSSVHLRLPMSGNSFIRMAAWLKYTRVCARHRDRFWRIFCLAKASTVQPILAKLINLDVYPWIPKLSFANYKHAICIRWAISICFCTFKLQFKLE